MELNLVVPEDMRNYTSDGLEVTNFVIVYHKSDFERNIRSRNQFKPQYGHQVYGARELIFGYRDLRVTLYYLHNTAHMYLDIQYSQIFTSDDPALQPDDIQQQIFAWYPEKACTDRRTFLHMIARQNHRKVYGCPKDSFMAVNKNGTMAKYEVRLCNIEESGFVDFHRRYESLIVWFIDQANPISLDDDNWIIFYLYEEIGAFNPIRTPVGFCTVYKFYHYESGLRARISQFFILPTHQRLGLGSKFYRIIFDQVKSIPGLFDITVEKPCIAFTNLRDRQDCLLTMNLSCVQNITQHYDVNIAKEIKTRLKVSTYQSIKLYDIFYYMNISRSETRKYFKGIIKKRFENYYKRQHARYVLDLNCYEAWKSGASSEIRRYGRRTLREYITSLNDLVSFINRNNNVMDVVQDDDEDDDV